VAAGVRANLLNIDGYLHRWVEHEAIIKGKQPDGIKAYVRYVRMFFEYLTLKRRQVDSLSEIGTSDIDGFLKYLFYQKQNTKNISRATKLAALRSFFRYLIYAKFIEDDPTANIPSPRIAGHVAHKFTTHDLSSILSAIDMTTTYGLRDKAMLYTIYGAGLRVSEVCNLELRDIIDTRAGGFVVNILNSKRGRSRTVPLGVTPSKALREWIMARITQGATSSAYVFVQLKRHGFGQLSKVAANNILKKYAEKVSIADPRVFIHKLRTTWATDLYDSGTDRCRKCGHPIGRIDLVEIAVLMGHSDPKTTMRYIAISEKVLLRTTMPESRFKELEGLNRKLISGGTIDQRD